jgi:hypothetical protein
MLLSPARCSLEVTSPKFRPLSLLLRFGQSNGCGKEWTGEPTAQLQSFWLASIRKRIQNSHVTAVGEAMRGMCPPRHTTVCINLIMAGIMGSNLECVTVYWAIFSLNVLYQFTVTSACNSKNRIIRQTMVRIVIKVCAALRKRF